MVDEQALREAFSHYAEALLAQYEVGDVLYALTDQVVSVLGIDGAGVSLGLTRDGLRFVTATDQRTASIEQVQAASGEGPCYEAFRSGASVAVDDLRHEQRWPEYRDAAAELQIRAVAGIPMPVSHNRIGALNLYASEPREWTADELGVAQLLANVASGYILHGRQLDESRTLAGQLQRALDSRIVIEQAKGILAGRHGIDISAAFERLRNHSRDNHARIHEVCRQVIAGELDV